MMRKPAVAGFFYPGSRSALEKDLQSLIERAPQPQRVFGLVVPHAGYVYSGPCAGKGFGRVQVPNCVVVLGVNHRGAGKPLAVDGHDIWETPLGEIGVDIEARDRLVRPSKIFVIDSEAGRFEHSLEVQVPFIQYLNPDARILPVVVSTSHLDILLQAGRELAGLFGAGADPLLVSSTDMSHYIPARRAKELDAKAIEAILAIDPEGLFNTVMDYQISMCGVAPTVIMLAAARARGIRKAELVAYTNSGEKTGDLSEVVAYASVIVF